MDYIIAVPSYNRHETILKATLSTLQRHNIPKDKIIIFVADQEQYDKYPTDYKKVIGEKGMMNIRNFMTDYFEDKQKIFYLDDDIYEFYQKDGDKITILNNLHESITNAFDILDKSKSQIFGFYPVNNGRFMKDEITLNLTYIVGCCYGVINDKELKVSMDDKEDYERSIKSFLKYGNVVRINNISIKTKYYTEKGGLQSEGMRNADKVNENAQLLVNTYPELCKINTGKKNKKWTEVKLISEGKRLFKERPDNIQDALLQELQSINWLKNTDRPNVSGVDEERTKEYNDRGDPRKIGKPCFSYTFGYIRPRRAKLGTHQLTQISKKYPDLYNLLKEYAKSIAPDFKFTSITANKNIVCQKHTDKNNQSNSLAVALGDFTGGYLYVNDVKHDIRYSPLIFNGREEHYSTEFTGERYSLIYYSL